MQLVMLRWLFDRFSFFLPGCLASQKGSNS